MTFQTPFRCNRCIVGGRFKTRWGHERQCLAPIYQHECNIGWSTRKKSHTVVL
jgi:hypothetical protein